MTRTTAEIGENAFILEGTVLRIRWMRFSGDFPARAFLRRYPDDFAQFIWRAQEMANTGRIAMKSQGHPLQGRYSELYQFNMSLTRSWGFKDGRTFVVLDADTKKKGKAQEVDYKRALALRSDYSTGIIDD